MSRCGTTLCEREVGDDTYGWVPPGGEGRIGLRWERKRRVGLGCLGQWADAKERRKGNWAGPREGGRGNLGWIRRNDERRKSLGLKLLLKIL